MIYQTQTVEVEIIAEASLVHRHTSVMLDVKTRANEIDFFNIYVDESPIVPYEIYRRYVSGSPQGSVTISGDTIGRTAHSSQLTFHTDTVNDPRTNLQGRGTRESGDRLPHRARETREGD